MNEAMLSQWLSIVSEMFSLSCRCVVLNWISTQNLKQFDDRTLSSIIEIGSECTRMPFKLCKLIDLLNCNDGIRQQLIGGELYRFYYFN